MRTSFGFEQLLVLFLVVWLIGIFTGWRLRSMLDEVRRERR
jgi:hypothetical protein